MLFRIICMAWHALLQRCQRRGVHQSKDTKGSGACARTTYWGIVSRQNVTTEASSTEVETKMNTFDTFALALLQPPPSVIIHMLMRRVRCTPVAVMLSKYAWLGRLLNIICKHKLDQFLNRLGWVHHLRTRGRHIASVDPIKKGIK